MTEAKKNRRTGGRLIYLDEKLEKRVEQHRLYLETKVPGNLVFTRGAIMHLIHVGLDEMEGLHSDEE
jgi:hypothetical protein